MRERPGRFPLAVAGLLLEEVHGILRGIADDHEALPQRERGRAHPVEGLGHGEPLGVRQVSVLSYPMHRHHMSVRHPAHN